MAFFPTTQGLGATLQGAPAKLQEFIFGPGTDNPSYESLQKKRAVIDAMMQRQQGPINSHAEGIGGIVNALIARHADRRLSGKEDDARAKVMAEFEAAMGGGGYSGSMSARNAPPAAGFSLPPQGDRAAQIRDGLIRRGLPEHVADGFLLNMKDESGLDPGINEISPTVPGSRGGFGLIQWTGPRRVALEQAAAERGVPVNDIDLQLDQLVAELQGPEAKAASRIMSTRNPGEAAAAIATDFLRPAPEHLARRVAEYTGGAPTMSSMGGSSGPDMSKIMQIAQLLENPYLPAGHRMVAQAMIAQAFEGQQAPNVNSVGGRLVDDTGRVIYEPPAEGPTPTDDMREYEFAQTRGYDKPFEQFLIDQRRAGANAVVTPYDSARGGQFAARMKEIEDAEIAARKALSTLSAAEEAMNDPGFYSGAGGQTVLQLKRIGQSIGLDPEGIASAETFNALASRAVLDSIGGSLGAQISNSDRDFIERQAINLGASPEGNRAIVAVHRRLAQRQIDVAKMAREYERENGALDAGFNDMMAEFAEKNPLFSPDDPLFNAPAGGGAGPTTGKADVPQIKSKTEFDALPSGTQFIAPDGSLRVKP
jgi:hypothetical protein